MHTYTHRLCSAGLRGLVVSLLWAPAASWGGDDTLALACPVCHGAADRHTAIPDFRLLREREIALQLREFRDGRRDGTAMPRIAQTLSDAEIDRLAARLGGQHAAAR